MTNEWSQCIKEILKIQAINWETIENITNESINDADLDSYLDVCKLVLDRIDQKVFADKSKLKLLHKLLLQSRLDVLSLVLEKLKQITDESIQKDGLIDIFYKFVFSENLEKSFRKTTNPSNNESLDDKDSTLLVNLPTVIFNTQKLNTDKRFSPVHYFPRLCDVILKTLKFIHRKITDSQNVGTGFLRTLSGKICSDGHQKVYYNHVLNPLTKLMKSDFIWRRIGNRLVTGQSDRHLESIIKPLVIFGFPASLTWFLKDTINESSKIRFLLTNKFLLVQHFTDDRVLINIISYLSQFPDHLWTAFKNLLDTWSNGSALKFRSADQQYYISAGLILALKNLKSESIKDREKFFSAVVYGMQIYLKSCDFSIRNTGLFVGESLTRIFGPEGPKLSLEHQETEEVAKLKKLLGVKNDPQNLSLNEDEGVEKGEENVEMEITEQKDDDDELVPYDISCDTKIDIENRANQKSAPTYLGDCMKGLQDENDPEYLKLCLFNCVQLIEKNRHSLDDHVLDLASTLLYLENVFDFSEFPEKRNEALVTLGYHSPIKVGKYLTDQFHDSNHGIGRRLDILDIIAQCCRRLTGEADSRNDFFYSELIEKPVIMREVKRVEASWKQVIEDRIKGKTRIISEKKEKKLKVNKFHSVAGYFFFDLMRQHGQNDITFKLMSDEFFLLGRLLFTLGFVLDCASQAPIARKMGEALIGFIWNFRYHTDSFVRIAVIFCFSSIVTSVPSVHLIEHMQIELSEFGQWLSDLAQSDIDQDCVKRALEALLLLKNLTDQQIKTEIL